VAARVCRHLVARWCCSAVTAKAPTAVRLKLRLPSSAGIGARNASQMSSWPLRPSLTRRDALQLRSTASLAACERDLSHRRPRGALARQATLLRSAIGSEPLAGALARSSARHPRAGLALVRLHAPHEPRAMRIRLHASALSHEAACAVSTLGAREALGGAASGAAAEVRASAVHGRERRHAHRVRAVASLPRMLGHAIRADVGLPDGKRATVCSAPT